MEVLNLGNIHLGLWFYMEIQGLGNLHLGMWSSMEIKDMEIYI